MKKPKRVSLAVKVNIVIMAMVLSVSVLLTLISENAYQKAVFMPYFRKLENAEILEEELKPFLQEFLPYLGTEELNQVISESDREGTDASYYYWLLKEPGMREAPFSLYDDWMEFEITLYGIRGNDDLHEISCIAEKDGKLYNICTVLDNEDSITASLRDYGFGRQIPEGSPAPADYLSPKYFKEKKETWLIRCIPIGLEDGNRVFIWLKYDLTEAIREHGNFLLRCVLLTIGVTLLASVITSLVMRRFALIPDAHGVVIGARKGVRYREQEIDLMPGAKIFLFTDGVTEARNAEGIMFGEARMVRALNEVREKSPNEILLHMKKTVDEFVQDVAQFDDQTMLCLEYRGPACYNDDPVRESF